MYRKTLFFIALMALFAPLALSGQTNFTQTTTSDFLKGTGLNVNIANDCISLQNKMSLVADWTATTNLPQTLESHQVVTWRNYVYCVGGYNGSNPVNTVYRATQQDNGISGWSSLNSLPVALRDMGVAATQTRLIVVGGRNNDTVSDKIYSAPFNDDGSIGTWQELSVSLPQPCWGMRAVEALGSIYIIGGANTDSNNDATNKVYRLKVNAVGEISGIVEMNSLPEARNGHAVALYDSKIIVTGGYDASFTAQNKVYSVAVNQNGTLGTWQTKAPLTEAVYGHTTVCANGILTVIGGHNGSLPSNKFYYADADATTYSWTLSDVMMTERYTQCASFAFGDKIFLSGGEATSGTVNSLVSYMAVTTSSTPVKKSSFIGTYYVGTPKTLQEINYTLTNPTSKTYEILYRTAGEDLNYSNWTSASNNLPAVINQSKSYVQYMFRVTATGENDFSIDDVTLTVAGYKQLAGNLNDMGDLTLGNSPYLVTETISFTSGTHNIDPGVTIMFMPNTGLNIGQASVNFNGTQANPILLTAYESGNGSWNGVYFQDASDNGVSSVMNYTTIEKAGNGSNAANLRLYYTNQPTMSHCTIRQSVKDGAYFQNSSPTLTHCTITENGASYSGLALINSSPALTSCTISNNYQGLHLNNSAPTCNSCTMTGNTLAGIYFQTTNFNATFTGVTCSNNLYGLYSCSPNRSFTFDSSVISFSNNTSDIAVAGGQISSDQTWNNYTNGYAVLGELEIYGGTPKLTIMPGTTIKVAENYRLYIGRNSNQGGMLYAVGTAAQPITFTSLNGEVGGWVGLYFRDGSDYNSSSSMRHCIVEKAATNLLCVNTNQPSVMWCTFQDAQNYNVDLNGASISIEGSTIKNAPTGLWVSSASPALVSVVFENHSEYCVYHNNTCTVTYSDCTIKDSYVGIRYETPNRDMVNNTNITFQNNTANIGVPSGDITVSRNWDSNSYAILDNVRVGRYYTNTPDHSRLTIMPGSTLKFAAGKRMEISWSNYYGELYAEGTMEQPITFTSINGEVGGWNGLVFNNESDSFTGASSSLKHCILEKGNEYNLYLSSTNQPGLIEDCTFSNSAQKGVYMYSSRDTLRNCHFESNGEYPLYYNSAYYVWELENLTFTGNQYDGIAINGGDITWSDRVWNAYTYYILENIRVGRSSSSTPNHVRLIIMPGSTLKFAEGKRMEISWSSHYGELYAEGTTDQPITFTSMNGEVGGWNGLVFNGESDDFTGASSSLKHCILEKGNEYNLHLSSTNQPGLIEDCTFSSSAQKGVYMYSSRDTLRNCHFESNGEYPLYYSSAYNVWELENLTFTGNQYDGIAINGGDITWSDRVWNAYTYYILENIRVGRSNSSTPNHVRLTIMPGSTLKFAAGKRMEISWSNYYGELYAEGTTDQPITFTSMNGEVGGWNGLVFNGESDDFTGASSSLKHCILEKGNEYNLHLSSTNQPGLIEDCTFSSSAQKGVYMYSSRDTLRNCHFESNGEYPLYYNSAYNVWELENLTFTGNQYDGIAINGGDITWSDRVWNAYTYYILENIRVGRSISSTPNHVRLTIMPGSILKFAEGKRMEIAFDNYCGELYAIGTEDQPITFTPMNGEIGGWNGLIFTGRSDDFSNPSSLLKYCIFEKGNEYNLMATGTTLPEIENCVFQNSNQYGLYIDNEYCQTIKNTVIKNNASHGIYITNTTPFTLGGSPEYACSVYGNGGYAVYQNGSSNIDMTYNFWGQAGPNQVDEDFIYDKLDNSSKGRITVNPTCWFPMEDFEHVQGTFIYDDNKLMSNREMNIISLNDSIMATATTNGNGQYDFSNYQVSVYNTLDPDFGVDILAGVNATDALLVMRHFVHLDTLTGSYVAAADVNLSGSINGTDAMLILRRTVDEQFPSGDYYYYSPNGMSIEGTTCNYDLSFLCYGDVNGSYTPQTRDNTIELITEGRLLAASDHEMELPVSLKTAVEAGALTLRFGYPEEYIEIEDVTLATTGESLLFAANEGELKTVWYSLEPMALAEDDGLIIIKVRTKDLSNIDEPLSFSLEAYSELADGSANVLENVVIAMPELVTLTLGVDDQMTDDMSLSVYPNPAMDVCRLSYQLAEAGRVTVAVYNMLGVRVMDAADFRQEEGRHELQLTTSQLAAGVYNCRVTFEGESSWVKSTLIIIEK